MAMFQQLMLRCPFCSKEFPSLFQPPPGTIYFGLNNKESCPQCGSLVDSGLVESRTGKEIRASGPNVFVQYRQLVSQVQDPAALTATMLGSILQSRSQSTYATARSSLPPFAVNFLPSQLSAARKLIPILLVLYLFAKARSTNAVSELSPKGQTDSLAVLNSPIRNPVCEDLIVIVQAMTAQGYSAEDITGRLNAVLLASMHVTPTEATNSQDALSRWFSKYQTTPIECLLALIACVTLVINARKETRESEIGPLTIEKLKLEIEKIKSEARAHTDNEPEKSDRQ